MSPRAKKPTGERVIVDDKGVSRRMASGKVESVRWSDLSEVRLMTTATGAQGQDLFFVLVGATGGCIVPQGLAPNELVDRLQALPGFDSGELICALGSTENAEFVCWRRAGG